MNKTRIVYTVNDPIFFLSHRLPLAIQTLKNNWEVYLISDFSNTDQKFFKDQKIIPIHISLNKSSVSIRSNLSTFFSLSSKLKNLNPTIIHNITLKMSLLGSLTLFLGVRSKIINAISGLGYLYTDSRSSLSRIITASLFRGINKAFKPHYIFQNKQDVKIFKHLGLKSNYTLIKGSGVDAKKFSYTPSPEKGSINILCTSRMLKDKGIIELIEACKLLAKKEKSFQLTLLGKIDLENPAHLTEEELINTFDIPQIKWLGHSDEINDALKNCHIYCLPSYREGLPKSIVEAMAIGRPIVTTNAPGCADCVIEGVNGYKVPIKDAYALAEKLEVLIDDSELRLKMGKESRKFFEKEFTLDKVVRKHMEIYHNMLMI